MMIGTSGRSALALGRSSRPVIPRMLMSERIKIRRTSLALLMPCRASGADLANSMLKRPARRSRRNCWRNSTSTSGSSSTTRMSTSTRVLRFGRLCRRPRQNNPEFRELPGSSVDLYRPGVLLDDDVVTDRQAKARTLARRLGGKKRIEDLFPDFRRNANTIVTYPDLHTVAEALCHSRDGGLEPVAAFLFLTLGSRIEAI